MMSLGGHWRIAAAALPLACSACILSVVSSRFGPEGSEEPVTDTPVTPPPTPRTISGQVSGLQGVLSLSNGDEVLEITADGPFSFATTVFDGDSYSVLVLAQPTGLACTVTHGSGMVAGADVSDIEVICAPLVLFQLSAGQASASVSLSLSWETVSRAQRYEVWRDDVLIGSVSDAASFEDVVSAEIAPALSASHGTNQAGVELSWSYGPAAISHRYALRAYDAADTYLGVSNQASASFSYTPQSHQVIRADSSLAFLGPEIRAYLDTTAAGPLAASAPLDVIASDDQAEVVELSWSAPSSVTLSEASYQLIVTIAVPTGAGLLQVASSPSIGARGFGYIVTPNGRPPVAVGAATSWTDPSPPRPAWNVIGSHRFDDPVFRIPVFYVEDTLTPTSQAYTVSVASDAPTASAPVFGARTGVTYSWQQAPQGNTSWTEIATTTVPWIQIDPPLLGLSDYQVTLAGEPATTPLALGNDDVARWKKVSARAGHACGIRSNDTIQCWGVNINGQAPFPAPGGTVNEIAAGGWGYQLYDGHTCAVMTPGYAFCWGDNTKGQAPKQYSDAPVHGLSSGGWHSCGIKDDERVACWGQTGTPPTTLYKQVSAAMQVTAAVRKADGGIDIWDYALAPPAGTGFKEVALRTFYFGGCAINASNAIQCFGDAPSAPAGTYKGLVVDQFAAIRLSDNSVWPDSPNVAGSFKQLATMQWSSCAIDSADAMFCWGEGYWGEAPGLHPAGQFTALAQGGNTACGLRRNGSVFCWNTASGNGFPPFKPGGPPVAYRQVDAEAGYACAVGIDDALSCWALRPATMAPAGAPAGAVEQVATEDAYACRIAKADGTISCWGTTPPTGAPPGGAFKQIALAPGYACGISASDALSCWWDAAPAGAPAGTFKQVAVSAASACALNLAGAASCWGAVTQSPPPDLFKQIALTQWWACGIKMDDGLKCWKLGAAENVPVPNGTFVQVLGTSNSRAYALRSDGTLAYWDPFASQVEDDSGLALAGTFKEIATGEADPYDTGGGKGAATCAIRAADNSLVCWGFTDYFASSGLDAPPAGAFSRLTMEARGGCALRISDDTIVCFGDSDGVTASGSYKQVAQSFYRGCGIHTDDSLTCWGDNGLGQAPPTTIGSFKQVVTGKWHTCAIRTDDSTVCYGDNTLGQLGAPAAEPLEQIAAGLNHTCGIRSDTHELLCWGSNSHGQSSPPNGSFSRVIAHANQTCAVDADGHLVCFGNVDGTYRDILPRDMPWTGLIDCFPSSLQQLACFRRQ